MTQDQIQGKILAHLPWNGYMSLEEISIHTRLPILICKENIYRLIFKKMVRCNPKDHTLVRKCTVR